MAFAKPLSSGNSIGVGIRENIRGQGQQDPINRAARHLKEQKSEIVRHNRVAQVRVLPKVNDTMRNLETNARGELSGGMLLVNKLA
tara:strand:+ start:456 stop:713 length:258 start_codon:yes stop_codon:yes gene_type:complete